MFSTLRTSQTRLDLPILPLALTITRLTGKVPST